MFKKIAALLIVFSYPSIAVALNLDPHEVKAIHMRNCISHGGDKAVCLCSYDNALKLMTLDDLATVNSQMGGEVINSGLASKLERATRECSRTVNAGEDNVLPPPPPPPASLEPLPNLEAENTAPKNYLEEIKQTPPAPDATEAKPKPARIIDSGEKVIKVPVEPKLKTTSKPKRPAGYFGEYDKMFFEAVARGNLTAMRALAAKIADYNVKSPNGDTALIVAVSYGQTGALEFLLNKKIDVNLPNSKGQAPLHIAGYTKRADIAEALIDAHANLNATYGPGYTPLFLAVMQQNVPTIQLLLGNKARVNQVLNDGNTELHIAAIGANPEIIQLLVNAGAKLNATNKNGYTPLMVAAYTGNIEAVRTLLSLGANPGIKDKAGRSALTLANTAGKQQVVNLLLAYYENKKK